MKALNLLLGLLLLAPLAGAQNTVTPVGKRNPFARATIAVGHEIKESFVDIKRHPLAWGVFAVASVAVDFADAGSTCKFRTLGIEEANPLMGSRPSCARVNFTIGAGLLANLASVHYLSNDYVNSCRRHAADPNDPWNNPRLRVHTRDPESCRWAIPAAFGLIQIPHVFIVKSNIDIINQQEHENNQWLRRQ